MTDTFAAKFSNHEAAADYADLNGWKLESTAPMERGVWATFATPATCTTYSIHRAADHEIIETARPETLQQIVAHIAARIHRGLPDADLKTTRLYIHNGRGIVAAGLCRQGTWHDTVREDYMHLDPHARMKRTEARLSNDPI